MFEIDWKLCDALRYGKFGIVKARDKKTETTSWYVWAGEGDSELADMTYILRLGTKYKDEEIESLKERFKPYTHFKNVHYEAETEASFD